MESNNQPRPLTPDEIAKLPDVPEGARLMLYGFDIAPIEFGKIKGLKYFCAGDHSTHRYLSDLKDLRILLPEQSNISGWMNVIRPSAPDEQREEKPPMITDFEQPEPNEININECETCATLRADNERLRGLLAKSRAHCLEFRRVYEKRHGEGMCADVSRTIMEIEEALETQPL